MGRRRYVGSYTGFVHIHAVWSAGQVHISEPIGLKHTCHHSPRRRRVGAGSRPAEIRRGWPDRPSAVGAPARQVPPPPDAAAASRRHRDPHRLLHRADGLIETLVPCSMLRPGSKCGECLGLACHTWPRVGCIVFRRYDISASTLPWCHWASSRQLDGSDGQRPYP